MKPFRHNLEIPEGSSYTLAITRRDKVTKGAYDFTSHTAALTFRNTYDGNVLVQLTTENGGLEIDVPTGKTTISLTVTQTKALKEGIKSFGVWDLMMYPPSDPEGALMSSRGIFKVLQQSTRV